MGEADDGGLMKNEGEANFSPSSCLNPLLRCCFGSESALNDGDPGEDFIVLNLDMDQ
jgi:hypothetical protein